MKKFFDTETAELIRAEALRQEETIDLIPSENIASLEVLAALGSVFTNKYSEGYPGARYYYGNEVADCLENLARDRATALFGVPHANVQPYSGSPANLAVYVGVCQPGETVMGLNLPDGGHMTHGWKFSATSTLYTSVPYHTRPDGYIDLDEVRALAREHAPRLIWVGATAYPRKLPFAEFAEIADECGAYLAADISHIAGLVVGGVHESPVPYAHIITTTTHKTLRGPRGAMILTTERGLAKDPRLATKIDKAVIPGLQGGPHNNQTAALAVALFEAAQPEFTTYARQVVANANALADGLCDAGLSLATGGTDNHLLLFDCGGVGRGAIVGRALEIAGLVTNKNTIPNERSSPFYPSGIRLGSPSVTTRGMKEPEMKRVAEWIAQVIEATRDYALPDAPGRKEKLEAIFAELVENETLLAVRVEVRALCARFPVYPNA